MADMEDILKSHDLPHVKELVKNFKNINSNIEFDTYVANYRKELRRKGIIIRIYKKTELLYVYNKLILEGMERNRSFETFCKPKGGTRENSGVLVVTLVMSPYPNDPNMGDKKKDFTCEYDCYYCPKYPDMPRSYIPDEPAVARAIQNDWDPVKQFLSRIKTYDQTGIDCKNGIKAEVILEGGTYNSYPESYRIDFIHKIFYVANLITKDSLGENIIFRNMLSLKEEHKINESAFCKIVGLSIETRPDKINIPFIIEMRQCGVTRVQIGVQHTSNYILRKVNRGSTIEDTKNAMKLLKNTAFKIAIHIMPDLPFSSPEIDAEMFRMILDDPDISFDYIKIYPVMVTDYTVIKKWYDQGKYKPYSETSINKVNALVPVIAEFKKNIPPWIRNERIIRDIPIESRKKETIIFGGCKVTNLRQEIKKFMDIQGTICNCIRCKEVKLGEVPHDIIMVTRKYKKHDGIEYFISYENKELTTIYGFCRLRLPSGSSVLKELEGSALIRELHVYGKMNAVGNNKQNHSAQHIGLGSSMLKKAEDIARKYNYKQISVISAIGTKNYYRKKGYTIENLYQIKILQESSINIVVICCIIFLIVTIYGTIL